MFLSACKQENSQGQANLHKIPSNSAHCGLSFTYVFESAHFLDSTGEFSYQADFLSLFVPTFKIMGWFDEK